MYAFGYACEYACMLGVYVSLYVCLYAGYVYAGCGVAGSFAGARSSLAILLTIFLSTYPCPSLALR